MIPTAPSSCCKPICRGGDYARSPSFAMTQMGQRMNMRYTAARRSCQLAGVLLLVLAAAGCGSSSHKQAIADYCSQARVDHTTALNTETLLGQPDSTVRHAGTLYLAYGSVTFYYNDFGDLSASPLAGSKGC